LTDKTYQNASQLSSKLMGYVKDLYNFTNGRLAGDNIQSHQIKEKVMELIIPHPGTPEQIQAIEDVMLKANEMGIRIDIIIK
jgi:hypothetical protein